MIRRFLNVIEKIVPYWFYENMIRPAIFPVKIIPLWKHMSGVKNLKTDWARRVGRGDDAYFELLYHGGKLPIAIAGHLISRDNGETLFVYVDDYKDTNTWASMTIYDKKFKPMQPKTMMAVRSEFHKMKERARPMGWLNNIPAPFWIIGITVAIAMLLFVIFQYGPAAMFKPRTIQYILEQGAPVKSLVQDGILG